MFKDIKGIIYDGGQPGRAFGGGVFNASCNIGFSGSPTKLTLQIASEDGSYSISDDDLDVTSGGAKTIEIGDIKFHRMYVYSYSFNDSPTAKTLTVNLVDQSLCLDKIFVGLVGRHGTASKDDLKFFPVDPADPSKNTPYNPSNIIQATATSMTYGFRLLCLECNSLRPRKILRPSSSLPLAEITRLAWIAGDGQQQPCPQPVATSIQVDQGVDCINGGYILLGKEQFTQTNCEIPKVEYSFEDLCNALDYILGGDPLGCNGDPVYKHNLRDFNRSATYQQNYAGMTLREVLSAWAADFGFDFSFDYSKDDLWVEGIDLENSIDLSDIQNAIEQGFGPDSNEGLIRNMTDTHTLENTYKQKPLVKFIKPPRPFIRSQKHYEPAIGRVITMQDAVHDTANLGRTNDELEVSFALAKYSPDARIIWLSNIARYKWNEPGWKNPDPYPILPYNVGPPETGTFIDPAVPAAGIAYWITGGNGCKECPNWKITDDPDLPLDPHGNPQKFSSEWSCISRGYGTGAVIPNDLTLAGVAGNKSTKPGWQHPSWRRDSPWMALGFFPEWHITDSQTKADMLGAHEEIKASRSGNTRPFTHPIWHDPENYEIFIGIWNENYQSKVQDYDRDVAQDFYGKWAYWCGNRTTDDELDMGIPPNYGPVNPPPTERQCPKFLFDLEGGQKHTTYTYHYKVSTSPESKIYSDGSYPFKNILKVNDYFFGPHGVTVDSEPCTYCPERSIFELEDNSWGTPEDVITALFANKYILDNSNVPPFSNPTEATKLVFQGDLRNYVPIFSPLGHGPMFHSYWQHFGLRHFDTEVYKSEYTKDGYIPGIAFIPKMDKMKNEAGIPILEIDYDHWKCKEADITAPNHWCSKGCADTDIVGPDICGGIWAITCWECKDKNNKLYGHVKAFDESAAVLECLKLGCSMDFAAAGYTDGNTCLLKQEAELNLNGHTSAGLFVSVKSTADRTKCLDQSNLCCTPIFQWQSGQQMYSTGDVYGFDGKCWRFIGDPMVYGTQDDPTTNAPYNIVDPANALDNSTTLPFFEECTCCATTPTTTTTTTTASPRFAKTHEYSSEFDVPPRDYYDWEGTVCNMTDGSGNPVTVQFSDTSLLGQSNTTSINTCLHRAGDIADWGPVVVAEGPIVILNNGMCVKVTKLLTDPTPLWQSTNWGHLGLISCYPGQNNTCDVCATTTTASPQSVCYICSNSAGDSLGCISSALQTNAELLTECQNQWSDSISVSAEIIQQPSSSATCCTTTTTLAPIPYGYGPCAEGTYREDSEILNALVYENTRRRKLEWLLENPGPDECTPMYCEEDIVNQVCGCDSVEEPIHYFTNYMAKYINIRHLTLTEKIIFPVMHPYVGHWKSDITEKGTYPKKQIVMGEPPLKDEIGNVMATRVVDSDVTQDLDTLELGDPTGGRGAFHEQLVVSNPYNVHPATGVPIPEVVDLPTYYSFLSGVTNSADKPNQSINIKVDGTEFDTLTGFMTPSFGLASFTVSLSSDGISTDLTFVSRPKKLPKRDVLLQKIGPRAIEGRIPKPSIDVTLNDWGI
ncbi:MAG: hypothetical protein CMI54_06520 [Parcubacteria group bacterium]|nr:hypothetical protein [Parcubacteria group bacterium]